MRVVLPAFLDSFDCAEPACACRRALAATRAAGDGNALASGWPPAAAERSLWYGGQQAAVGSAAADPAASGPVAAVAVGSDVELYFLPACPTVRDAVLPYGDALDLLRRPDGWRLPLQAVAVDDPAPEVWIAPQRPLPWNQWTVLREALLDVLADPGLPLLGRMARVLLALAEPPPVPADGAVRLAPLTARDFLHVRAQLEARMAAQSVAWLAKSYPAGHALFEQLPALTPAVCKRSLQADWRSALAGPLAQREAQAAPQLEVLASMQVFAMPLARALTLQRCASAWLEGWAVGLRWLAALSHATKTPPTTEQWLAALAAADTAVAVAAQPLPAVTLPEPTHQRGPKMADLDLSFASLA